jgi:hypothetical protein
MFEVYIDWVYTGKLSFAGHPGWPVPSTQEVHDQYVCVQAYIIGECVEDEAFQKTVLEFMVTKLSEWEACLGEDMIALIWEPMRTSTASLLKDFVSCWMDR